MRSSTPRSTGAQVEIGAGLPLREAREEFERQLIQSRLQQYNWDLEAASQSLGLSRSRLYELIRRHGLKEE